MSVPFIAAIRNALDVPAASEDLLTPLGACFAATDSAARQAAIGEVIRALNAGVVAGALLEVIQASSTVLNPFKYERDSAWRWGTHLTRRQLVEELWNRSVSRGGPAPARAAFLLAAEQGFPFGFATMLYLLAEPTFQPLTGWSDDQVKAVAALLDRERQRTISLANEARVAADAITKMIEHSQGMDDAEVARFFAAAEKMSQLAPGRPDVQMRLANCAWRVWHLAGARGRLDVRDQLRSSAARWGNTVNDPHMRRWLQEVLNSPSREIRTPGTRPLDPGEILH